MIFSSLIGHAAELYRIAAKTSEPSDAVASSYLHSKKYIGSKERKFISAAVFATLRLQSLASAGATAGNRISGACVPPELGAILAACLAGDEVEAWQPLPLIVPAALRAGENTDITALCCAAIAERIPENAECAAAWVAAAQAELTRLPAAAANARDEITGDVAAGAAMPAWILQSWATDAGVPAAVRRAVALFGAAPVCLRVNSLLTSREAARTELLKLQINSRASTLAPHGLLLEDRANILQTPLYRQGAIEVQDEGSQLIAHAAAPNPNDSVLDFCAGAGGKALHFAALQRDSGHIVCSDAFPQRMKPIAARAARCGVRSIILRPVFATDRAPRTTFDLVLVDAPCSGLGTVRRSPNLKWRLTPDSLRKITRKQDHILRRAAQFVGVGGMLLYATCSLMRDENEAVVGRFLDHDKRFAPNDLHSVFARSGITVPGVAPGDFTCNLTPDAHGTDGFFMARMRRIS